MEKGHSGRSAGSWFGPASISIALREVLREQQTRNEELNNLAIYVAQDSTVFIRDALEEMKRGQRALMLIIPLRLGFHHINEVYVDSFKRVFHWKYCAGVMGGRPKHSLFFVGYQDNDLIYLDPHFNQDVVDLGLDNSPSESYHCSTPMKINVAKVDPTCAVAFYCADQVELWELISLVRQMEEELKKSENSPSAERQIPMLNFVDARHADLLDPDRDFPRSVEIIQEDSMNCDSLESNFSSLEELKHEEYNQAERLASGKSSVPNFDESVVENVETWCRSDVDKADAGFPLKVGNSRWYLDHLAHHFDLASNSFGTPKSGEFSFVGDDSVGSYSMLEDARHTRDVRTDFSFLTSEGNRCKLVGMHQEEDGFVLM